MKKDEDYPTADPYLTVTPEMKARVQRCAARRAGR